MRGLLPLTVANLRSFDRDRAALFWTLAFPVIFVILFGTIFSGGEHRTSQLGWVDQDGTPASAQLRAGFARVTLLELTDGTLEETALTQMRDGRPRRRRRRARRPRRGDRQPGWHGRRSRSR